MFNKSNQIAYLNDKLRVQNEGGRVVIANTVEARELTEAVMEAVRNFNFLESDKENNPYGENDFGVVEIKGEKFYFKIDYYDKSLKYGSNNPASSDPEICQRVMTVMHSSDY